ncbi:hypothetical protein OHT57_00595 [Streptomyces sp. NBC_00285]|uniref:hypothetical protein n=1 Tax=Streptomyces sp. NBC_00285 TaxID=2975700 RepID=UPI002E28366F|nr:hypothetical protein [Streptomyces sp. NBC_00285]
MGISSAEWLVAPMVAIEEERAAALLTERFGIEGTLEDLGSNHDRAPRLSACGRPQWDLERLGRTPSGAPR